MPNAIRRKSEEFRQTGKLGKSLARSRHNRQGGMPVQNTKPERWDGEEIHSHNGLAMISDTNLTS
jgi:hypothetical protein